MSFQARVEVDNILYFTLVLRTQAKRALEQSINTRPLFQIPKTGKTTLILIIVVLVFALAVLQDFIYSRLQGTGFYLPESLLYNTFWVLFIPFTIAINRLIKRINSKNDVYRFPLNLGIGVTWSFLHILLFAAAFVLVSNLVFTPAHRFSHIFNAALSNQLYIALLWYIVFPVLYFSRHKPTDIARHYAEKIRLKNGVKVITVLTSSIQLISTDKPYSSIYVGDQKYLDGKSLKEFEKALDPTIFLRVHRSAIVNVKYIKELESRSNGDYDAKLENGQTIRLSRHYRNNWKQLLR
jgi:two-component system LytT family response regulator